jgi:hypothetical protein
MLGSFVDKPVELQMLTLITFHFVNVYKDV